MSRWPSTKARVVLAALLRIGWSVKRQAGTSHKILSRPGWANFVFALQAVVQTSSPCGLRSKTGDRTEAFTAENAEHAERGSRIE